MNMAEDVRPTFFRSGGLEPSKSLQLLRVHDLLIGAGLLQLGAISSVWPNMDRYVYSQPME